MCVANGVEDAELIMFWRASDLYCHGNLMRYVQFSYLRGFFREKNRMCWLAKNMEL